MVVVVTAQARVARPVPRFRSHHLRTLPCLGRPDRGSQKEEETMKKCNFKEQDRFWKQLTKEQLRVLRGGGGGGSSSDSSGAGSSSTGGAIPAPPPGGFPPAPPPTA